MGVLQKKKKKNWRSCTELIRRADYDVPMQLTLYVTGISLNSPSSIMIIIIIIMIMIIIIISYLTLPEAMAIFPTYLKTFFRNDKSRCCYANRDFPLPTTRVQCNKMRWISEQKSVRLGRGSSPAFHIFFT